MGIHTHPSNSHITQLYSTSNTLQTKPTHQTAIMSSDGRKDFSDKAAEKLTPQSQKSTTDKVKESVTNTADSAQREIIPDSEKSHTQSAADKATREKHHETGNDDSLMGKAKNLVGANK